MRRPRRSIKLLHRAQSVMPGGISAPVQSFQSVGRPPLYIKKASAAYIWDDDRNKFIDYVGDWGSMILGHANPGIIRAIRMTSKLGTSYGAPTELEVRMAELLAKIVPSVEMVQFTHTSSEAVTRALVLARAFTQRPAIIRFDGSTHGLEEGQWLSGIQSGAGQASLLAQFNDPESVRSLVAAHPEQIAAVILEPAITHQGCIPPSPGFLASIRELCTSNGILLIFDESTTGFRVAVGGAQELYGVRPDVTIFGGILGGGLPIGAVGGRRDILQQLGPSGPVHTATTHGMNQLAVAAGYQILRILSSNKLLHKQLEESAAILEREFRHELMRTSLPFSFNRVGSMFSLFFANIPVIDVAAARKSDPVLFGRFFGAMLEEGVYLPPSPWETAFVSTAHTHRIIERTIKALRNAIRKM